MTIYCYNELDVPESIQISDTEILEVYYPYWYEKMVTKFGKELVDTRYTKQDCVDDWVIANWAWKVNEKKEENDPPL